jgi:hypothetical protein
MKSKYRRIFGLMEETRNTYRILMGKPQKQRELGSPMWRWDDIIEINIKIFTVGNIDWILHHQTLLGGGG